MTQEQEWSLTEEQRQETVSRIRLNLSTMAFFRQAPLPDDAVATAAVTMEKKAYTVAKVEARTTTGVRPHHETLKAYIRKLGALMIETVESGAAVVEAHAAAATAATAAAGAKPGMTDSIDLSHGSRDFLITETAEQLLAPMLQPGAVIRRIKFSTKSFGIEAAEVAAKAIRNVSNTLQHADLADIIAGRPESEALGALTIIAAALAQCHLKFLDLSDNALGEKGIRAAAAAFVDQPALENIAFRNVGCSVHGCAALQELISNTSHLKSISLYNNMSGDEGAVSIAALISRCPVLEEFSMVSSRVGAEGGAALGRALAAGTKMLVKLDVHDNPMTEEAAAALATAIMAQPHLLTLNLNDTCLCDKGVSQIAAALQHATAAEKLETLELALNEITPDGAEAVAMAIVAKGATLKTVNLRENELEDDGAVMIAKGLMSAPHLRTIDLCLNQIHRVGALAVAKVVVETANDLELLALDENEISDGGVEQLKKMMESGGKLGALGALDENLGDEEDEDGDEGVEDLAEILGRGLKL